MRSERCRVVVNCRPTFEGEEESLGDGISLPHAGTIQLKDGKSFDADRVYLPSHGGLLFEDEVQKLVSSLYDGINSTVFAYGSSGSGKTHTVLGCGGSLGLIDRIADEVFARYDHRNCTVSVSVEELYCERFTDLLAASAQTPASASSSRSNSSSSLHAQRSMPPRPQSSQRSTQQGKYSWQTVSMTSSAEMKALVQHVLLKRHTASTYLNDKSSRSHVIITITLEQRKAIVEHRYADENELLPSPASSSISASAGSSTTCAVANSSCSSSTSGSCVETGSNASLDSYLIGKMYLVDLAGSENIKRSGADGTRQKEAGEINKSLCHLKTVIEEIYKGGRVATYRNSRLTFRLEDALGGGNSKLLVIACISTAKSNLAETKETLRFAQMARAITNTPQVNREPKDEVIHRLQQQVADLQDMLRQAKEEGGRTAPEEVLQQLNVVEAAYADLQVAYADLLKDMNAREAASTKAAGQVQEQVSTLHSMLLATQSHEATLQQQLTAEQLASRQFLQQLAAEQEALKNSQLARTAAAARLLSLQDDMQALLQQCSLLRQQVASWQQAVSAGANLCEQQEQQVQELQHQVAAQAEELTMLRQQLQDEQRAHQAAGTRIAALQQQCGTLEKQLHSEQASRTALDGQLFAEREHMQQLQQLLSSQDAELAGLRQQLQDERQARAAADAQVHELQQHAQAVQAAAEQCAANADQGVQQLAALCAQLQEQVATTATWQEQVQQQQQAVVCSLQASQAAQQALEARLLAAEQEAAKQSQHRVRLEQLLQQQEQEHTAVLSATAAATAKAAADAAKEHFKQKAALEAQLQAAQDSIAKLQAQLDDERSEHEAILTAERLRHSQQLAESMHSSVKKLTADKLRCREHMSMQMHSLKAEAQSLYQALAAPSPLLADEPHGQPSSPSSDGSGDLQDFSLSPTLQAAKRISPVPPLQLESSETMLSDTTAAPMQDASERHLGSAMGNGSSTSSAYTSNASTPSCGAMDAAAATAALVAVAAAAAAATATRAAAAASKGQTPRPNMVSVHVEAGSQAGSAGSNQPFEGNGASCQGHHSPAADFMSPLSGTIFASPSAASMDGSQHSGMHPAAAAAASAAAAAVAARVRSSHERRSRQRRRRRDFGKGLSSSVVCWPTSYLPKAEVDMVEAAAAFNQLRGGALTRENLQNFLKLRMLDGKLHIKTLPAGGCKCKHHLVQDMLAYHRWHLAQCTSASSDTSSARTASTSSRGVTPTPHSSASSSPESCVWHPLGLGRPLSAAPSSATSSLAKADILRYSHDALVGRSSGGGSGSSSADYRELSPARAAFALETADVNRSSQQPDVAGPKELQPAQQPSSRWSWLTPRRRKHQSILAQLQAEKAALHKLQQGAGSWASETAQEGIPAGRGCDTLQLSVQVPECGSEGGSDAVSPRDKKHAAAAGRSAAARGGTGSNPSSQPSSPGKLNLSGRVVSACTGSAVSEFYTDSPAVKLPRSRSSSKQRGSSDPLRRSVDLGSSHRSGWRQVQLTRTK